MAIYDKTIVTPVMAPIPTSVKDMKAQGWGRDPQRPDSWQPPEGYHTKRKAKGKWKMVRRHVTEMLIIWYLQHTMRERMQKERMLKRWQLVRDNFNGYFTGRYWWRLARLAASKRRARKYWKKLKGSLVYAAATRKAAHLHAVVKARKHWKLLRMAVKAGGVTSRWRTMRRWRLIKRYILKEYLVRFWMGLARASRRKMESDARMETLRKFDYRPTKLQEENEEETDEMVRLREMLGLPLNRVGGTVAGDSAGAGDDADGDGESGWVASPLKQPPHSLRGLSPLEGMSLKEPWGADAVARARALGISPSANYATACLRERTSHMTSHGVGETAARRRRRATKDEVAKEISASLGRRAWDSSTLRRVPPGLEGINPMTPEPWAVKDMLLHPFGVSAMHPGRPGEKVDTPPREAPWTKQRDPSWAARELHAQVSRAFKGTTPRTPRGRQVRPPSSARDMQPTGARSAPTLRWPLRATRPFTPPTRDYAPSANGARRNFFASVTPTSAWMTSSRARSNLTGSQDVRFRFSSPTMTSNSKASSSGPASPTPRMTPRLSSTSGPRTPRNSGRRKVRSAVV